MAKAMRKPTTVRARGGFSPKWIQNAMKSLGVTTKEVLKDITPNLYETSSTVASSATNLVKDIRKGNMSTSRIMKALNDNKYMQYAQRAYKNALSDIRTGNLNNKSRESSALTKSMGMDDNDSFSFGDIDGVADVNVSMDDSATVDAVMKVSSQIEASTVANVKMQKASMDAILAANATMMNLSSNQHGEIMSQLSNINSSLAALVEYNNENMSKFIEASMTYYDKVGAAQQAAANEAKQAKVAINDIFANKGTGGIKFDKYKSLIKQNIKRTISEDPNLSMFKMVLDNDQMMDMLVSNPIGMASKIMVTSMMPKMITNTLKGFEEAFSQAIPNALMSITDLQNDGNKFKQFIGKIFGLDMSRKSSFDKSKLEKGPIPFDTETKHAITHIITTELSRQTAYLSILAKNVNPNADKMVSENRRFFSHNANDWITKNDASRNIANEIVDAISNAFNSQNFGKSLNRFTERYKDDEKAEAENTVKELFYDMIKSGKKVSLSALVELVSNSGASAQMRNDLKKYIINMYSDDRRSFDSANLGMINANVAYRNTVKNIQDNDIDYNLQETLFKNNADIDPAIYSLMGWGAENRDKRLKVKKQKDPLHTNAINAEETDKVSMYRKITGGFTNFFKAYMVDSRSAIENASRSMVSGVLDRLSDLGEAAMLKLVGTKGDNGKREGGIFSDLANSMADFGSSIKWYITGKSYTDTNGVHHEDNENSVFGTLRNIGTNIKDGIMMKIFGKKKDENGNYIKEEDGLFDKIKGALTSGVNSWKNAFFGIDENDPNADKLREEHTKKTIEYVKEAVPGMTYGAVAGASFGIGGGLLGSLIGGPIGGIGIGLAVGLASKSEKFQKWLFGEKDEKTGERAGGLISANVQKYFKDNKEYMIGSAAIGSITGTITGGGLLGTLIGGPFAGAIMGMASGYVLKSKTFKEFLFGDEEKGKMGLIKSIQYRFKNAFKGRSNKETEANIGEAGMKFLGTGAVGMGAGGLIGLMLGGPVYGALAGLALSAKAAKGTLREFLFGKEEGLTLADGTKVKKQGLFGVIGNYVNANIIKPMSTQVKFIAKDFMSTVKHKMLAPFGFLAESISENIGNFLAEKWGALRGVVSDVIVGTKNLFVKALSPVTNMVGKAMSLSAGFIWKNTKFIMSAPGVLITSVLKALDIKRLIGNNPVIKFVKGLAKDIRHAVLSGIKGLFKGIFHIIKAPFSAIKWAGSTVIGGARKLWNSKLMEGARNKVGAVADRIKETGAFQDIKTWWEGYGKDDDSIIQKIRRNSREYKEEQEEIKKERAKNKLHDKNAKLIAKASKGQFGDDTDAARQWLKRHKPGVYKKLIDIDSVDEDNRKAKIAKEGSDGSDMSPDQLARPSAKLSWKGKILKLLHSIDKSTEATAKGEQGKGFQSFTETGARKEADDRAKAEQAEADKKAAAEKEKERWDKLSFWEKLTETSNETGLDSGNAKSNEWSDTNWLGQAKLLGRGFKNFFKNDFGRNTKKFFKGIRSANQRFIDTWTGGRRFDSTEEALDWLRENNPRQYARYIKKFGGAGNVENHFLGGLLGKGLSLVGEAGAELLHNDGKKTKVLSHDKTKKLINGGLKPGDVASAFGISHKTKEAEEEEEDSDAEKQADESRSARLAELRAKAATGKTTEAEEEEMKAAKAAIELDKRSDSLETAGKRNYTAAEQMRDREEAKAREAQLAATKAGADASLATKDSIDSFSDLWSSVFSPKGILTAGILGLGGWLLTKLPNIIDIAKNIGEVLGNVWNYVKGPLTKIFDGIKTAVGGTVEDIVETETQGRRTNGNSALEQAQKYGADLINGNFLTDSEGRVTANTNLRTRGIYKTIQSARRAKARFAKKLNKIFPKAETPIKNAAAKAGGFVDEGAKLMATTGMDARYMNQADEFFESVAGNADNIGAKVAQKASAKAGSAALSGATKTKGLGIIKEIVTKAFNFLKKGIQKIGGSKVGKALKFLNPLTIVDRIAKAGANKITALVTKITGRTVADTGMAFMTAGLSVAIEAGIGAVDGLTGAAKLFMVDKSEVTGLMRTISALFGALANAPFGWAIMLIFQFIDDISGANMLKNIASGIYAAFADSADVKELKEKQDAWEQKYFEYQDEQIQKAYNEQRKAGKIDRSMDYQTFKTNVQKHVDGFDAEYQSFGDWNANENASMLDKAGQFVGNVAKGAGRVIGNVGKGIGWAAGKVGEGVGWLGNKIGAGAKAIWNSNWGDMIPGVDIAKFGVDLFKNGGDIGKALEGVMNRFTGRVDDVLGVFGTSTKDIKAGLSKVADDLGKGFNETWSNLKSNVGDMIDGIGGFAKDFGKGAKKTWDNMIEGAKSFGKDMGKFADDFGTNAAKTIDGFKTGAAKFFEGAAKGIGDFIKDPGKSISDAADWVGDKVSNIWKGFTDFIGFNTSPTPSAGGWGDGDDSIYYSQNDPRWKNNQYGAGAKMSNAGCGPTAISMAIQTAKKRQLGGYGNTDPVGLANMAQMTGDRDSNGTNWNFVGKAIAASGLNGSQEINPSASYIAANAALGNPVILSGKSRGSSDPYTKAGHYVTAVGMRNGKVLINDPRGRSYSRAFSPKALSRSTQAAYAVNAGGFGVIGGYGPEENGLNTNETSIIKQWLGVVATVKTAIAAAKVGYNQKQWITIDIDGVKQKLRTDCSGFVTACLQYYGVLPQTTMLASGTMGASSGAMKNTGFTHMSWTGVPALRSGDILVTPGKHTEIFSHIDGGNIYVYNCGDDATCNSPNVSQLSYKTYVDVWRPGPGKPLISGNPNIGTPITNGVSAGATSGAAATGDAPQSGWSAVLQFIGEAMGKLGGGLFDGFSGFKEWAANWGLGGNNNGASSGTSLGASYADLNLGNIPNGTGSGPNIDLNAAWVKESIAKAKADPSGNTIDLSKYKNPDPHGYIAGADEFVKIVGPITVALSKKNGAKFPSAIVGQKAMESGWGKSNLTKIGNNFGGIKSTPSWRDAGGKTVWFMTGETNDGKSIYKALQPFRVYDTMVDGLADYYNVISNSRYDKARAANTPYDFLNELHNAGYGGLNTYASDIMKIVDSRGLRALDEQMDKSDADKILEEAANFKSGKTKKSTKVKATAKNTSIAAVHQGGTSISGMGDGLSSNPIRIKYTNAPSNNKIKNLTNELRRMRPVSRINGTKISYTSNIPVNIRSSQSKYSGGSGVSPELMLYIAEVLTRIASNTGESNIKLDYLKNLKGSTTNNIYNQNGSKAKPKKEKIYVGEDKAESTYNESMARRIARGV